MYIKVCWRRKRPHIAQLPAFDELQCAQIGEAPKIASQSDVQRSQAHQAAEATATSFKCRSGIWTALFAAQFAGGGDVLQISNSQKPCHAVANGDLTA